MGITYRDAGVDIDEGLTPVERAQAMRRLHEETAASCDSVNVPTPDGMLLGLRR